MFVGIDVIVCNFTGSIFRTGTTGQRWQLDPVNGLSGWDADNEVIFGTDANGNLNIGGDFIATGGTIAVSSFYTSVDPSTSFFIGPDPSASGGFNGILRFGDSTNPPSILYRGGTRPGLTLNSGGSAPNASSLALGTFGADIEARSISLLGYNGIDLSADGPIELYGSTGIGTVSEVHLRGRRVTVGPNGRDSTQGRLDILTFGSGSNTDSVIEVVNALRVVAPTGFRTPEYRTHTSAANVFMSSGTRELYRSTSARAAKVDIETPTEPERILAIEPRTWYDRGDVEQYAEHLHQIEKYGESDVRVEDVEPLRRIGGLVAEEVLDAGLDEYVAYDDDGGDLGLAYYRLWTLLIPLVRDLRDRVEMLERGNI